MIFIATILLAATAAVNCQGYRADPYYDDSPKPYAFSFDERLEDGGHIGRSETADGSGRVQGSYTLTNDEGHTRYVDYVADQYGFRANIRTNEPGTDNKNPADVVIESAGAYANIPSVIRRPVVNTLLQPAVEPVEVAPEPVLSPRPSVYRRPVGNRYQYRQTGPFRRN